MAALEFEWDSRDLEVWRGEKVDGALARALRLAGNQAIRGLRRDATAFALARKNLPEPVITDDQALELPRRKVAIRDFAWALFVRGQPIPASKFPHLDTRKSFARAGRAGGRGVIVKFGEGQVGRIAGAFAVTLKSGHQGIFRRRGKGRLPIDEAFSTRLPKRFGQDVMTTYGEKTYRKLQEAYTRGLDRELAKLRRKGEV